MFSLQLPLCLFLFAVPKTHLQRIESSTEEKHGEDNEEGDGEPEGRATVPRIITAHILLTAGSQTVGRRLAVVFVFAEGEQLAGHEGRFAAATLAFAVEGARSVQTSLLLGHLITHTHFIQTIQISITKSH